MKPTSIGIATLTAAIGASFAAQGATVIETEPNSTPATADTVSFGDDFRGFINSFNQNELDYVLFTGVPTNTRLDVTLALIISTFFGEEVQFNLFDGTDTSSLLTTVLLENTASGLASELVTVTGTSGSLLFEITDGPSPGSAFETYTLQVAPSAVVPLPASLAFMLTGVAGLAGLRRLQRRPASLAA
ncbi:MAG: VPLPA-CTERM sorting domain-containing protein [Pseudomonadota bacterium]